jgi:hypothetical protein
MKSFLFTIKNPHNLRPQVFNQKTSENAIYDDGTQPPGFSNAHDLYVCDKGNSRLLYTCNRSYSDLGTGYANETGIAGNHVLTGAGHFTVKEIEVFEVI